MIRKNVKAIDLKLGDVVRYSTSVDGYFMNMMVVEVNSQKNVYPAHLILHRPYLINCRDSLMWGQTSQGQTSHVMIRPHIGIEPVMFFLDSDCLFDILSEGHIQY